MTLQFGTAGVRAPLGAGPDRLNEDTVARITAGVASWLPPGAAAVVGHDARHGSAAFAAVAARELRARGIRVVDLGQVPTPVLAFTARQPECSAGVMVTASHNPATDNGIKVFDATGAQLDLAQAAEVEAAIARPRPAGRSGATTGADPATGRTGHQEPVARYLDALPAVQAGALRLVYTPLHGVGGTVFRTALHRAGFGPPQSVTTQADPDPDFPTAPFPNPEEPGVLDGLRALAADADLGLAHDPDADRLAVVVGARTLTGDEVGLLLADEVLRRTPGPVATTVVSSSALATLAARRGVPFAQTPTGFKHLVRAHHGELVYAYEEALGYCVAPGTVRDKDGISAGLLVCAMAAADRARGRTLADRLAELEAELGLEVATGQVSRRHAEPAALLRRASRRLPAGFTVTADEPYTLAGPEGGSRVVVRPSGTEPKLKAYLQTARRSQLPDLRRTVETWLDSAG